MGEYDTHFHNWRMQTTKSDFNVTETLDDEGKPLYKKTDYAFLLCQCGIVQKVKVEDV